MTPLMAKMLLTSDKFLSKNKKEKWLVRNLKTILPKMMLWTYWRRKFHPAMSNENDPKDLLLELPEVAA